MAAYQTPGPTISPLNVVPATQPDPSAFDRLMQAFRAGVVTQQEMTQALGVKPAEMVAERQAAETKLRVQPLLANQTLQANDLALRKGEAELSAFKADPTGVRKHIATKLSEFGIQPTGDPVVDSRTLRAAISTAKADLEWQDKSIIATAEGVPALPNETPKDHVTRAGKEMPSIRAKLNQTESDRKQLEAFNSELTRKGKPRVSSFEEATAAFAALNKEEETKKAEAKPPSESEAKRAVYLAEIEQSNKALADLHTAGYKPESAYWDQILPDLTASRFVRSAQGNAYVDARDKWIEAVLRDRSGSAINKSEYPNAARQYFPAPGDTESQIKAKQQTRVAAEGALRASIENPALRRFFDATGAQFQQDAATGKVEPVSTPSATVSPSVRLLRLKDGSTVYGYRNPDGSAVRTDPSGKPLP